VIQLREKQGLLSTFARILSRRVRFWRLRPPMPVQRDGVSYVGMWVRFRPETHPLHDAFARRAAREQRVIRVLGPFSLREWRAVTTIWFWLLRHVLGRERRFDFFLTHENTPTYDGLARNHIGFWLHDERENVFRFPYWMLDLLRSTGQTRSSSSTLTVEGLTTSSSARFGEQRAHRRLAAAILTNHLRPPRGQLIELVRSAMPCDVYGEASGRSVENKTDLLNGYVFCLCPENSVSPGYVTEKVPDAVMAGCIPITWCDPDGLQHDFNEAAVVNLHGLSEAEARRRLQELVDSADARQAILSEPLLKRPPDTGEVERFIQNAVLSNGRA